MQKFIQILWKLFLVTFPFSLHWVLYEKSSYRFGHFNPWVTGILYLPEILLILTFLLWGLQQIFHQKIHFRWPTKGEWLLKFLFLNLAIISLIWGDILFFLFFALRMVEAYMLYILIKNQIVPTLSTVRWLLGGAIFQVILAITQVQLNHSLGLSFLGESYLHPELGDVAKIDLPNGDKQVRGYGTFLHPNILAVYLMTVLFIALPHLKKAARLLWPAILLAGIYFADSQAAELTTLTLIVILILFNLFKSPRFQKITIFGLFSALLVVNTWFFFNSDQVHPKVLSLVERMEQNQISADMIAAHPWGVGVGQFTLAMEDFSLKKLMPWEFQPVHNAYFLGLNEWGIQGLILLLILVFYGLNHYFKNQTDYRLKGSPNVLPFFGLLVIASFDHLLLTSYLGLLLIALAISPLYEK